MRCEEYGYFEATWCYGNGSTKCLLAIPKRHEMLAPRAFLIQHPKLHRNQPLNLLPFGKPKA